MRRHQVYLGFVTAFTFTTQSLGACACRLTGKHEDSRRLPRPWVPLCSHLPVHPSQSTYDSPPIRRCLKVQEGVTRIFKWYQYFSTTFTERPDSQFVMSKCCIYKKQAVSKLMRVRCSFQQKQKGFLSVP